MDTVPSHSCTEDGLDDKQFHMVATFTLKSQR